MTPAELEQELRQIVQQDIRCSLMIWGPPGVGKSSIVARVASTAKIDLVDLRLSQLAPTDLRGLPVAEDGRSTWYPPNFLPRDGKGVLFLDEINMAPPAMQGVAQQLILDRRIGEYTVPEGWFVWAAGNRKIDRDQFVVVADIGGLVCVGGMAPDHFASHSSLSWLKHLHLTV